MEEPPFSIRDAVDADLPLLRELFAGEGFSDLPTPDGVRVAASPDNTVFGALRCEQGADGAWYVRPVVVFDAVQHRGVGSALVDDALSLHADLRLSSRGDMGPFYESCGLVKCGWEDIAPEFACECLELCPDRAACAPQPYRSVVPRYTLTFLGTSAGCGVPAFFCHCPACEEARRDPAKRRSCTGAVVRGNKTTLIDAPPDLRAQLVREDIDRIDRLFLTHAHYDHMGGLGELEYFIRLHRKAPLGFSASAYALSEAMREFSYMEDAFELDAVEDFGSRAFDGLSFRALPLEHCPGCVGWLITTPYGTRTFYAPDTAALKSEVVEALQGVDTLVMDATFWKNMGTHRTHHLVKDTIAEGLDLLGAGRVVLQHLAPHMCNPGVDEIAEICKYAARFDGRVIVAEDGMELEI